MNECNYPKDVLKRFWNKVIFPDKLSDCWIWKGGKDKDGYGQFYIESNWKIKAHRFAYQCAHGPIKNGIILHSCDNPSCCNPRHLSDGTIFENNKERSKKGRSALGLENGNSKLKESDVKRIKKLVKQDNYTYKQLSKKFNVSVSTIFRIVNNKSWSHINE